MYKNNSFHSFSSLNSTGPNGPIIDTVATVSFGDEDIFDNSIDLKIAIVGDCGVGKTAILERYSDGRFTEYPMSTLGVDLRIRTFTYEGKQVKMHIWDTAGQERFNNITASYLKNVDAVIIAFSLTHIQSFYNIHKWIDFIKYSNPNSNPICVIAGNKCDATKERAITSNEISTMLSQLENTIPYFETSAKNNINTDNMFSNIIKTYIALNETNDKYVNIGPLTLQNKKQLEDQDKCCLCKIL